MGLASVRLAEDAWQLIAQPSLHLLVIPFAGFALGLLAGPAQTLFEDLADVLGVEGDAEALADQPCDPAGRPQLVGPAMLLSSLQQQAFELTQVVVGQAGCGAGGRFGIEALRAAGHASPAMHGGFMDAEDAGHGG